MIFTRRHALGLVAGVVLSITAGNALAADPLKVASYPANPPWENKTEAGTFEGFEVDIANDIAKRLGTTAEFEGMDFKALFVASASGRVDLVISSLTITDERLKSQSFTQPYFIASLGIAAKEGSDINTAEDLKGKTVGAIATSTPEKWAQENAEKIGFAGYKSYDTLANMLTDLQNGRVDAVVNDMIGLRYAAKQTQGVVIKAEIVTGEKFAMMIPKDSPNLEKINQAISDIKSDGSMAKYFEHWFGVAPAEGSVTVTPMPVPTSAE